MRNVKVKKIKATHEIQKKLHVFFLNATYVHKWLNEWKKEKNAFEII